ncbi:MAG: hypothetical protein LUQ50_02030 [Methanospirillum sp.]|uniref:hypothetical protein n=1 Tax=Methanospirillum sp. TaxID=45200 RepID=UPI002373FC18|nr:hypothetical protein [Methanospirillum sp.]MDD1727831.1 hypothetical protein [Methanospirillum sp.]
MMNQIRCGVICSVLLVALAGFCIADEAPGYLVYVQGGEGSITNGSDGATVITVKDIVPYYHITDNEKSSLIPVERLANLPYPLSTALVFSGDDNETTFMVQVSQLSLSDGNTVLTLQVEPLPYYEGDRLASFTSKGLKTLVESQYTKSAIYMDMAGTPPENGCPPTFCCGDDCN